MKMDVTLFFLAFTMFWKLSQSIKCYKCSPEDEPYGKPACVHFNYSDTFITDCKLSTMCFKRETTLHLGNGITTKNEERGCTPQTFEGDQRRINGVWTPVKMIYEEYDEGCKETVSDYMRPTTTIDCYCRGNLCNTATTLRISLGTLMAVATLFFVR